MADRDASNEYWQGRMQDGLADRPGCFAPHRNVYALAEKPTGVVAAGVLGEWHPMHLPGDKRAA